MIIACGDIPKDFPEGKMFRISWDKNGDILFKLSGRMEGEAVTALKTLFSSEANGRRIALDLIELTLVDHDAMDFLKDCEADGIELRNCPSYVRKWIAEIKIQD